MAKNNRRPANRPRIWDGRGDSLDGMRYTILPADVADDLELRLIHLRFLTYLGRQNAKRGWCRISQAELAEKWKCSRPRLNQAINTLVKKGYVRVLSSQETHECWCAYKIVIASEDEVFPGGDTIQLNVGGGVPLAEQECSLNDTGVSHRRNTYTDKTDQADQKRENAQARKAPAHDAASVLEGEIVTDAKRRPLRKKANGAMPDHWVPSEDGKAFAITKGLTLEQTLAAFEKFRAHHLAKGSVMADWDQAWRSWVLDESKFVKAVRHGPGPGRFSVTDHLDE